MTGCTARSLCRRQPGLRTGQGCRRATTGRAVALAALLLGTGCAAAAPGCPAGTLPALELSAWFGLHSAANGRELSEAEWDAFRDSVLVPAFPSGSTVTAARGAWRHADGAIRHEASRVLTVLVPPAGEAAALARLRGAIAAYGALHPQEAVGFATRPACTGGFF
jgi:hypothetical protein